MGILKHTPNLNIESIEDGFVCLHEDTVCFINESAHKILMACNEKTTEEVLQCLLGSSPFNDTSLTEELKIKDILEAIATFVENGLVKEDVI